jgi:hypothetical protein
MAGVAADVSARQLQAFADEVDQQKPRLYGSFALASVHLCADQLFLWHRHSSFES